MKLLVKFRQDFGRMGELSGLFIAEHAAVEAAYDKKVYFGEMLGKHSEVYCTLSTENLTILADDQKLLTVLEDLGIESGVNPLGYIDEDVEQDDDEEA